MAPLFFSIYNKPPQILSQESIESLKDIGDWYMGKHYTYIRVFGCASTPQLLPKYVLDRLIVREIAYQTIEAGLFHS
jgi:hypothetical protein